MNNSKFSNDADKPFHTHEFAQAASGSSMGSTSAQSFRQRYRIEQNRRIIQRYRDSAVGRGSRLREELYQRMDESQSPQPTRGAENHSYTSDRQGFNASGGNASPSVPPSTPKPIQKRQNFSEPQARKYNPFS